MGHKPEPRKEGASTIRGGGANSTGTTWRWCRAVHRGCGIVDRGRGVVAVGCFSVWLLVAVLQSCFDLWTGGGAMGLPWSLVQRCLLLSHMKVDLSGELQCSLQGPGNLNPQLDPPPLAAEERTRGEVQAGGSPGACPGIGAVGERLAFYSEMAT